MSLAAESAVGSPKDSLLVEGVRIDLVECGQGSGMGKPLLFLHAENGIEPSAAAIGELAKSAHVIAPTHPGFGRSELPKGVRSVDDLSYFYLDLLDQLDLRDVTVVGVAFGAWIAAEIAVKSTARISRLVMANAVGVKVGDRETRDIADIFAITDPEYLDMAYCDPAVGRRDYKSLPRDRGACRGARAGSRPRGLPGIPISTIRGSRAGCTASASRRCSCGARMIACSARPYGRAYCSMIPGARFETIERAGHFPQEEQPKLFAEKVLSFAGKVQERVA